MNMSAKPRVTALIDTYNHERFIAEAIESVLAQDFPAAEMEILVVDDGSTDGTPEITARYADRVRHIRKENGGQASALNTGFAEARGEIIVMLDGDDVWLPRKVRRVVEVFDQHPEAGIVFHPYYYWYPDGGPSGEDTSFVPVSGYLPANLEGLLAFGGVGTCSTAIRKSCAERVMPIPHGLRVFADAFFISAALFVSPAVGINECLTKYRHHGSNLTAGPADELRARRALENSRLARIELGMWLEKEGMPGGHKGAETILERMALVEKVHEFALQVPARAEFLSYLRRYHRLYAPLWPPSYRVFDGLKAGAGFLLGYEGFFAAQRLYRQSFSMRRWREWLLPARRAERLEAQ